MDSEQAEQYAMGNSPEHVTEVLEEHLLVCARCRVRISKADAYLSAMREAAGEIRWRAPGGIERNWQLSTLLTAILAAAAVLLLVILAFR